MIVHSLCFIRTPSNSYQQLSERTINEKLGYYRIRKGEKVTLSDIDRKIDLWKEQLIDLSRRNDMVDFSAKQTKSLPTKDNNWQEIAAELADGNELYVWKPDQEPVTDGSGTAKKPDSGLAEIAQKAQAKQDGIDIERGSEEQRLIVQRMNSYQSVILTKPRVLCTVFQIISEISSNRKGVDLLYLALGMLKWYSVDYLYIGR